MEAVNRMMINESAVLGAGRIADRLMWTGIVVAIVASILVAVAAVLPIRASAGYADKPANRQEFQLQMRSSQDVDALLSRTAGRPLVRPPQIQPAVKDTGAAARLVRKLKLQGIIQKGDILVAYIRVGKQGVKTVREGEKVLDFVVKEIKAGRVTLLLEGVQVELKN